MEASSGTKSGTTMYDEMLSWFRGNRDNVPEHGAEFKLKSEKHNGTLARFRTFLTTD